MKEMDELIASSVDENDKVKDIKIRISFIFKNLFYFLFQK